VTQQKGRVDGASPFTCVPSGHYLGEKNMKKSSKVFQEEADGSFGFSSELKDALDSGVYRGGGGHPPQLMDAQMRDELDRFHDEMVKHFELGPDGKTPQYPPWFCDIMNILDPRLEDDRDCLCSWWPPFGWAPEDGCPEHDPPSSKE
jgi:hypothetical protein